MVTIRDVAREAGVSVSTVSFAFNGTAPVAPETKERIFEVIRRLNYQPNSAARGLAMQKTNNICLFTPHPGSDFFNFSGNSAFADLIQGIGEAADQKGYNILLSWDRDHIKTSRAVKLSREQAMDGILFLLPSHDSGTIRELIEMKVPFVCMGRYDGDQVIDSVDIDNLDASYRNTLHLIRLGHKRIAFISPGSLDYLVCADRLEGYKDALQDEGMDFRPEYVFIGDDRQTSGHKATDYFMHLPTPPTAIVAGRDIQAMGVLRYAREHSLSIPGDIALVSFENSDLANDHDITSITTNLHEIGRESARLLFSIIAHKRPRAPQNMILPSELIVRKSCGAVQ